MATTSQKASSSDAVVIDVMPDPSYVHELEVISPAKKPCCDCSSCCTCCGGRRIRWQQGVSLSGVAFDVVVLAVSILRISNIWGAVATAGSSALIHGFSTLALYIWQPQHDLEQTVEKAGEVEQQVSHNTDELQAELTKLRRIAAEQETQLAAERAFSSQFKQGIDEKVRDISRLTDELGTMRKGLEEARSIADIWKRLTDGLRDQISKLHPETIDEGVDVLEKQMRALKTSKESFDQELQEFSAQSISIQETRECWGQMLVQVTKAFQGLSTDLQGKQALLASAEEEIEKLKKETSELQSVKIDFERLKEKYDQLSAELSETTEELAKAVSILQSPEFAKILEQLSGEKK